jgi:hypothetical protein
MVIEFTEAGEAEAPHQFADARSHELLFSRSEFDAELFVRQRGYCREFAVSEGKRAE